MGQRGEPLPSTLVSATFAPSSKRSRSTKRDAWCDAGSANENVDLLSSEDSAADTAAAVAAPAASASYKTAATSMADDRGAKNVANINNNNNKYNDEGNSGAEPGTDDNFRIPKLRKVQALPLLNAVILEMLRVHPLAPLKQPREKPSRRRARVLACELPASTTLSAVSILDAADGARLSAARRWESGALAHCRRQWRSSDGL
jgi:hypothetical protein